MIALVLFIFFSDRDNLISSYALHVLIRMFSARLTELLQWGFSAAHGESDPRGGEGETAAAAAAAPAEEDLLLAVVD